MVEYMTECPCCNSQLKVIIDEASGKVLSTSFFDKHNQERLGELLQIRNIELGTKSMKGGG